MDQNYIAFGGTEVINTERLQAYVDNGLVPVGTHVDAHGTCEGIRDVLPGDGLPYRTPLYDEPPWYSVEDPDTWDFAGVLPLDITGLDGSTATVTVSPALGGGGVAGRRTWGPRTVSVSALLVGRTTASVSAGLAWLTTALHRTCVDDDTCGSVASLQGYTDCPGPVCQTADLDAAPLTVSIFNDDDPTWYLRSGTFTGGVLRPITVADVFHDGGTPAATGAETDDGGGPVATVPEEGGFGPVLPGDVVAPGILGGVQLPALAGPISIKWFVSCGGGGFGSTEVTLVLLDEVGNTVVTGDTYTLPCPGTDTLTWDLPDGVDLRLWRPGIVTNDPAGLSVQVLDLQYQPQLSAAQCSAPYERTLPRVTTVSGPTVVKTVPNGDCADFLQVEWTWVVGSPYRYGHTEPLALNVGTTAVGDYMAPGVSAVYQRLTGSSRFRYACVPEVPPADCYADPCGPSFTPAPAAPVIVDPNHVTADTLEYLETLLVPPFSVAVAVPLRDLAICLDTSVVPANEAVLSVSLRNDSSPKLGARVRVYDTVEGDCVETSACDFAYEFLVDYIPADGILTIDGVTGTVTTLCQGTLQDSSAGVAGTYGGARPDPVVKCSGRYLVHVQWLDTYPRSCVIGDQTIYTQGQPQGDLTVDVSLTPREG